MELAQLQMTPSQRTTAGFCPECGMPLAGLDVISHRDSHWSEKQVKKGLEDQAAVRFKMLTDYSAANPAKPAKP